MPRRAPRRQAGPASVFDVAEYILQEQGRMTAMQLHRLCYYSQAWHLAWTNEPLFAERIEAWANGPVVPALYELHRGDFHVEPGYFRRRLAKRRRQQRRSEHRRLLLRTAPVVVLGVAILAATKRRGHHG